MSDVNPPWLSRLLITPIRRPLLTLLIAAAVLAVAGFFVSRLQITPRLEALLPHDAQSTAAFHQVTEHFDLLDQALVMVESPDDVANDALAQERRAAALTAFADRLSAAMLADREASELIAFIEYRVDPQIMRFIEEVAVPFAPLYLNDAAFAQLKDRLTPEAIRAQIERDEVMIAAGSPAADQLAKRILRDPLRLHDIFAPAFASLRPDLRTWRGGEVFLSTDARALLIRIGAKGHATDMSFTKRFMALLRRGAEAAQPGELRLSFAGAYPIAELSEQRIRGDLISCITGSIILMQVLFLIAYRRLTSFPLVFLPVACGLLTGLGAYAALFGEISPITAGCGAIIAGLGVDYSIHYLSHYEASRQRGLTKEEAADIRLGLGPSMLNACITSMIGFLAIAATTVPALRDFAILGAMGLAASLLATITILPALHALLERRALKTERPRLRLEPTSLIAWYERRPGAWRIGAVVIVIAAAFVVVRWQSSSWFANDMNAMHPQPNPPMLTQEHIAERFGLPGDSMLVHLTARSPKELVTLADRVQRVLSQSRFEQAGVKVSVGLSTLLPEPKQAAGRLEQLGEVNADRILAAFRAAVADSIFDAEAFKPYEEYLRSLIEPKAVPDVQTLRDYPQLARLILPLVEPATGSAAQAVTMVHLTGRIDDLTQRDAIIEDLRAALSKVEGAHLTGISIVGRDIVLTVRRELPQVGLIACAAVLVWLIVLFRNVSHVVLAFMPALAGAVLMLTVTRLTGTGFNIVNMAALPILAGTAIDSGIFLVSAARQHQGDRAALVAGMSHRCHAITLCSLTTTLGFGSLMLASVPAVASLGLVLASGMLGSWLASVGIVIPRLVRPR
ncbi:MAG: MMPL family transporter [Phycisphaeraceae bacterium]